MQNVPIVLKRMSLHFLIVLLSLVSSCGESYSPINIDKSKPVEYVLIYKNKLLTGNEALILSDRKVIQDLIDLLSDNETILQPCDYHWTFHFQHNLFEASTHAHNQECEEYRQHNRQIHTLFESFFQKIQMAPSHFLYNVVIKAPYEPKIVMSSLMQYDDEYVCVFMIPDSRLPFIRLHGTSNIHFKNERNFREREEAPEKGKRLAINKLEDATHLLTNRYTVEKMRTPHYGASIVTKDNIEQTFESIVYFAYGQNLEGVETLLSEIDVEMTELYIPEEYVIQLASPVPLTLTSMGTLKEQYDFILDMAPYPELYLAF